MEMETFTNSFLINEKIEERFYCDIENCDFRTKSTSHLKLHKKSVHEGIKHQCDMCDRSYNFPGNCGKNILWQNSFYTMLVRRFEETQEDNSWGFPLSMSLLWLLGQSNPDSQEPHQQTPFTFVKCKVIMIFTTALKIERVKMFHLYLLHSKL